MSAFKVNIVAVNPKEENRCTRPIEGLVDTGSELTWLPEELLGNIGIIQRKEYSFYTATNQRVTRKVGYAIVRAEGFECIDEVVFAQPGDMTLLGVRSIEGFGVLVDNIAHKFVARAMLACGNK